MNKNWTRGEKFSAIGLIIAIISAASNKDVRCSVANIGCNKPQPVVVVQPSNELEDSKNKKTKETTEKSYSQTTDVSTDNSTTKPVGNLVRKDMDATNVIYRYYQEINSQNYDAAWSRLPISTQENKNIHPNGQKDFIDFFEKVREVQVLKMSILESTQTSAIISAKFTYNMKSGSKAPISIKYKVYREDTGKEWIIQEIKKA